MKPSTRTMPKQHHPYYLALRKKYPQAAILPEVTITDEEAETIYRSFQAQNHPYWREHYEAKGLPCDAPIPEGYDYKANKLTRRIDFLMLEGPTLTAIELKLSRADYRRDTEEKRRAWKRTTNRFIYYAPAGLITPEELPEGCGLWELQPTGRIQVTKKATRNPNPDPFPENMTKYFMWRTFTAETRKPR